MEARGVARLHQKVVMTTVGGNAEESKPEDEEEEEEQTHDTSSASTFTKRPACTVRKVACSSRCWLRPPPFPLPLPRSFPTDLPSLPIKRVVCTGRQCIDTASEFHSIVPVFAFLVLC